MPMANIEPIRPEYRDRDMRLKVMSEQGVARTLMFPTLAVTLEGYFADDIDLLYDAIHAFNRWLEDDWGFAYQDRIYSAGYICLMDVDRAIAELEWLLKAGARAITIRPGPPYGRSPGDPYFDPFWARVEEADVLVTYHAFDGPSLESRRLSPAVARAAAGHDAGIPHARTHHRRASTSSPWTPSPR